MVQAIHTNFSHIFTLFPHLHDHPLYNKDQADKFPAILDSFLHSVDCIGQVPIWVGGGGQIMAKCWV